MCVLIPLVATLLAVAPAPAHGQSRVRDAPAVAETDTGVAVHLSRVFSRTNVETERLVLVDGDGDANPSALTELSLLARPHGVDRPTEEVLEAHRDNPRLVAPGIIRLAPGLLPRLARISAQFGGRRIDIVSGYRPRARRTSRHRHGRALDIRVVGVAKERVVRFARTIPNTGVGFYPNSLFTHVDVRDESHYWVDRSGPGEPADYGTWPPSGTEQQETRRAILASARRAIEDAAPPARSASTAARARDGVPAPNAAPDSDNPTVPDAVPVPDTAPDNDTVPGGAPVPAPDTAPDNDTVPDGVPVPAAGADAAPDAAPAPDGDAAPDADTAPDADATPDPDAAPDADAEEDEPPLTPEEIAALRERLRRDLAGLRD